MLVLHIPNGACMPGLEMVPVCRLNAMARLRALARASSRLLKSRQKQIHRLYRVDQ